MYAPLVGFVTNQTLIAFQAQYGYYIADATAFFGVRPGPVLQQQLVVHCLLLCHCSSNYGAAGGCAFVSHNL